MFLLVLSQNFTFRIDIVYKIILREFPSQPYNKSPSLEPDNISRLHNSASSEWI